MTTRRGFIGKAALGSAGFAAANSAMAMPASSYRRIIGANDRLNVAIAGLGRRYSAYKDAIVRKESNVQLVYLCDVMKSQRTKALENFKKSLDYDIKLENDIRKVIDDKEVDVLFNSTPDHWHTPGAIMALNAGKNVYVEKPCSHDMNENELLVAAAKKHSAIVQMGNQQRSSDHTIEVINMIHDGKIGKPYKALAFYVNSRGEVPVQKKAPAPDGLDWDLFQGPAPRRGYTDNTWDYNWHWYGWDYGTAEAGNNGTHELDIARWALQVDYPQHARVEAYKREFQEDGWEMYDSMEATFNFPEDKIIQWDGKSRNGYDTYGAGRGTIIYGSEGAVFVDRGRYEITDLSGKVIKEREAGTVEAGTALGGGGDTSTAHAVNFFNTIRGKEKLQAPISDASISMAMVHYANMAYRTGKGFDIDDKTGKIYDRDAMMLWRRNYADGWDPTV